MNALLQPSAKLATMYLERLTVVFISSKLHRDSLPFLAESTLSPLMHWLLQSFSSS